MEKKKKTLAAPRLGSMPFMLVWVIVHIVIWVGINFLVEADIIDTSSDFVFAVIIGCLMGAGIALMQKLLLRYTYHVTLNWWMRVTIAGWVAGWLTMIVLEEVVNDFYGYPVSIQATPIFLIPAALQWLVLKQHTRQTWLWVLAGAVSGMTFGAFIDQGVNDALEFGLAGSVQGAVTGLALLWLFAQNRIENTKSKVNPVSQ